MKKQNNLAELAKGKRKAEGLENEGEVIDINNLVNLDEFGNVEFEDQMAEMKIEEEDNDKSKKGKKKKEVGMELDLDFSIKNKKTNLNYRQRKDKKKKSTYIVNF